MTHLETVWRQLVGRRLLPVAIVLVAALAAIPVLLAKDPEPSAPVIAPAASDDASTVSDPIVSVIANGERTQRRRVLGARKNPFEPAAAPRSSARATTAATQAQPASDVTVTRTTDPSGTTGSGATGTSPAPSGGSPTAPTSPTGSPAPARRSYELYSLTVRFGDSTSERLEKMNLPRLKALPSAEDPVLVYLGLSRDKKSAVFLVDSTVDAQGDGTCKPDPASCETILLRKGETEFFDVTSEDGTVTAQYQLDLVDIKLRRTASAGKARAARARVSKAGRRVLQDRKSTEGPLPYRYDAGSGTLQRLGAKAYEAVVARAANMAAKAGSL